MIAVSRGQRTPYRPHGAWRRVTSVTADRVREEADGSFGRRVAALRPDAVIDLICFDEPSARQMVTALSGKVRHFLHCGTIWVHGPSVRLPTTEDSPRRPIGEYGRAKAAIEAYLLDQAHREGFPATIIHPGHITGRGWVPINPAGNLDLAVFQALADGSKVTLPNLGMETLQHVHADDVARLFMDALATPANAVGESFHQPALQHGQGVPPARPPPPPQLPGGRPRLRGRTDRRRSAQCERVMSRTRPPFRPAGRRRGGGGRDHRAAVGCRCSRGHGPRRRARGKGSGRRVEA
ncbi:NAD-dependent epimerase/dehydratase family protein, partial [Spongiactinospora gelatinilytica]|uniref:NAD-dependent epimerase/dehydratase family protein n=1 Tax=Spongiactinospora gelatinilytica TaxID=2666298 RepID=UPI0018F56770